MEGEQQEASELDATGLIKDTKAATDIGPIKALLTPVSELLGNKLRATVENWFEQKSIKNLMEHVTSVQRHRRLDDVTEQTQMDLFGWASHAGKISPSEEELSAGVRASLEATLNGKRSNAALLLQLDREEILFLIGSLKGSDADFAKASLRDKGLVYKQSVIEVILAKAGFRRNISEEIATLRGTIAVTAMISAVLFPAALVILPMVIGFAETLENTPPAEEAYKTIMSMIESAYDIVTNLIVVGFFSFAATWPYVTGKTRRGTDIADELSKYVAHNK